MNNENLVKIDGVEIDSTFLMKKALTLTAVATQTSLLIRLLEGLEFDCKHGGGLNLEHFIETNGLSELTDGLTHIKEQVQEISDAICPDPD